MMQPEGVSLPEGRFCFFLRFYHAIVPFSFPQNGKLRHFSPNLGMTIFFHPVSPKIDCLLQTTDKLLEGICVNLSNPCHKAL